MSGRFCGIGYRYRPSGVSLLRHLTSVVPRISALVWHYCRCYRLHLCSVLLYNASCRPIETVAVKCVCRLWANTTMLRSLCNIARVFQCDNYKLNSLVYQTWNRTCMLGLQKMPETRAHCCPDRGHCADRANSADTVFTDTIRKTTESVHCTITGPCLCMHHRPSAC